MRSQQKETARIGEPVSVPANERAAVEVLSEALEHLTRRRKRAPKCELRGPKGESIPLPESVFSVLARATEVLARGDAVSVVPVGRDLTTQQAADLLNVSRQYVVRLVDEGRLPSTTTGKHRRLRLEDVLKYKEVRDTERRKRLDELTRISEDIGGYDELK